MDSHSGVASSLRACACLYSDFAFFAFAFFCFVVTAPQPAALSVYFLNAVSRPGPFDVEVSLTTRLPVERQKSFTLVAELRQQTLAILVDFNTGGACCSCSLIIWLSSNIVNFTTRSTKEIYCLNDFEDDFGETGSIVLFGCLSSLRPD